MEKIPGITILSKDYLYEVIYTILNKDLDDKLAYLLKKIIDTKFLEVALFSAELAKYKMALYKIIELKLKGLSKSSIEEILLQNNTIKDIIIKVNEIGKKRHINYTSVLEVLINKIKTISLYEFFVKYATYTNPSKMEDISNPEVFKLVLNEIETLYQNVSDSFDLSERIYTSEDAIDKRFNERILRLLGKSRIKIIPTGINLLDAAFRNTTGMESGEIYIIAAPYGVGKTRFVVRLGVNMYLNGANVYHVTIENKMEDVEELYDTALLGLSSEELTLKIKKAILAGNEDVESISKAIDDIKSELKEFYNSRSNHIFFKKYHPYKVNAQMIKSWITMKMSQGAPPPDVIIIDHMDIIVPTAENSSDSLFQRGEQVAGELKTLAEEFNAIVITPTQMNREGVKETRKQTESGGEATSRSMAKNELTGFLMTINQTREEALNGYARLYIDKNRIGIDKVTIPIKFDKSRVAIEPITDDETLLSFPERVREHVRILLKRLKGEHISDFDEKIIPKSNLDTIDDAIEEIYHTTEESVEIEEEPIREEIENPVDFIKAIVSYEKDTDQNITIEEDLERPVLIVKFGNLLYVSTNRTKLLSKLLEVRVTNPEKYQKLLDTSKTIQQISEILNIEQQAVEVQ